MLPRFWPVLPVPSSKVKSGQTLHTGSVDIGLENVWICTLGLPQLHRCPLSDQQFPVGELDVHRTKRVKQLREWNRPIPVGVQEVQVRHNWPDSRNACCRQCRFPYNSSCQENFQRNVCYFVMKSCNRVCVLCLRCQRTWAPPCWKQAAFWRTKLTN